MVQEEGGHGCWGLFEGEGSLDLVFSSRNRGIRENTHPGGNNESGALEGPIRRHAGEAGSDAVAETEAFEEDAGEVGKLFEGAPRHHVFFFFLFFFFFPVLLSIPVPNIPRSPPCSPPQLLSQPLLHLGIIQHVKDRASKRVRSRFRACDDKSLDLVLHAANGFLGGGEVGREVDVVAHGCRGWGRRGGGFSGGGGGRVGDTGGEEFAVLEERKEGSSSCGWSF